jgi:hypothetical protein
MRRFVLLRTRLGKMFHPVARYRAAWKQVLREGLGRDPNNA